MKFTIAVAALAGLVAAAPTDIEAHIEARQTSITENDLERGLSISCPDAILIFARGSTELGNMGSTVGPALAGGVDRQVSDLWVQGVGSPYLATLTDNALPRGSSFLGIREGVRLLELAHTKCPNAAIFAGGYSQGAALIAAAIEDSDDDVKDQIRGATLFGYTQNRQNNGRIPDFPAAKTRVYCAFGDLVCEGTLIVAAPHFTYNDEARGEAADFLAGTL